MSTPLFSSSNDTADFESSLATRAIGKRIHFLKETQSTNDLALEFARGGGAHGTVFVADAQSAGRGRQGRNWNCPPGMGLLFSVLIRPAQIPPEAVGWIPLAAGLACAEALAEAYNESPSITVKWPNDVVLTGENYPYPGWAKLGGILCESSLPALSGPASAQPDCGYAVVGIGLNINTPPEMLPETAKAPATSICQLIMGTVNRKSVFRTVLENLESRLLQLEDRDGRAKLREDVEARMRAWMPPWRVLQFRHPALGQATENLRVGSFEGLDEFGRIRIRDANGVTAYADAEIIGVVD